MTSMAMAINLQTRRKSGKEGKKVMRMLLETS
jgi:hypothetical protein